MKKSVHLLYFTLLVLFSGILLFITISVQQAYRHSANDPQIEIAESLSQKLATNNNLPLPFDTIEISKSISVFAIYYDKNKNAARSTALLNGKYPQIPAGIFNYADEHGADILTWQPQPEVRIALVVYPVANAGYIAIGRSLRDVEQREKQFYQMFFICWIVLIIFLGLSWYVQIKIYH